MFKQPPKLNPSRTVPFQSICAECLNSYMSRAEGQRDGPDHGGRGRIGRGRDHGRRNKRNSNVGSGVVDQSKWRVLDKSYREWLVSSGIAINAKAFNDLSVEQTISARSAYDAANTKYREQAELTALLKSMLISNANPYETVSDSHYSAQDSTDATQSSISYYGLPNENFCQVLGQQPEQIKICQRTHLATQRNGVPPSL